MEALNHLSAAEAARRIAAGKLKSEDLVQACLERINARDDTLQAWVHCDPYLALAQAREADKRGERGPLAGVPVGVKDVIDTADMPTQYNSAIYKDFRPFADAACVALARRAGAVILGKTVTTEFASRSPGPTRNPHNPDYSPGGSSSGSGAAVADFMVPMAFGTQTGGSTIRPAAYCGIVGYKPSFGTINCAGMKHLAESLDTIGVLARTVEDCALLVHAVSDRPLPDFSAKATAPRIGLCRTSRWSEASPAVQALLEDTAKALARKGATVRDVALPDAFDRIYDDQLLIMFYEAARALAWEHAAHPDLLSEHMRKTVKEYGSMSRDPYADAMRHARVCRTMLPEVFSGIDVLLTPSAPDEAPKGISGTGSSTFNRNWTVLHVPCVAIPAGHGPNGLPLGIQLVGNIDNDARALECAEWVRQALA
jgi:Asp-tRNA(Asn)/Glu-tRNA(Gln) amidotransferase A subunit family amidase